ncbi:MAG: hypothetical protein O4804_06500 [Trichodesmium sp. St11_bin5]|nr:hypothetical protein [Trichodesmium sp. St11_bin5]
MAYLSEKTAVSLPSPPSIKSLTPFPFRVSFSSSPCKKSLPFLPVMLSLPPSPNIK